MPPIISMKDSTKKLLNVEEIHETFAGGQKYVFIATCNKKKNLQRGTGLNLGVSFFICLC